MVNYIFCKTNYHKIEIVIRNSRCFQNLHNFSASGYKRFEILYLEDTSGKAARRNLWRRAP